MQTLKEKLEAIWHDSKVRNPLRKVHWILHERTGLPGIKRRKAIKRVINRLTKEFSWRR